jgi:hypothetical protein
MSEFLCVILIASVVPSSSGERKKDAFADGLKWVVSIGTLPISGKLARESKEQAIRDLAASQTGTTDAEQQSVAFLLAVARHEYSRQQTFLLGVLRQCSDPRKPNDCNEDSAEMVERLYWSGDKSLLVPLMDMVRHSDGALSESLGSFLSDVLSKEPRAYLRGIASFESETRRRIERLTGLSDGGGLSPGQRLAIRRNAKRRYDNRTLANEVFQMVLKADKNSQAN